MDTVHYILISTCCLNGHLQAEFLSRTYSQLRCHLELEVINTFEFLLRFICLNCIVVIYPCATLQNVMPSTLDAVH